LQTYVSEVTTPEWRATMSAGIGGTYSLGVLLAFAFGSVFHWRVMAGMAALLPILGFWALLALPETPSWYVIVGRDADAAASLKWLLGSDHLVEVELDILKQSYSGATTRQKESR